MAYRSPSLETMTFAQVDSIFIRGRRLPPIQYGTEQARYIEKSKTLEPAFIVDCELEDIR